MVAFPDKVFKRLLDVSAHTLTASCCGCCLAPLGAAFLLLYSCSVPALTPSESHDVIRWFPWRHQVALTIHLRRLCVCNQRYSVEGGFMRLSMQNFTVCGTIAHLHVAGSPQDAQYQLRAYW